MLVYITRDGTRITPGSPFEADGIAHPGNWASLWGADDFASFGISVAEQPDPPVVVAVPQTISDRQFFQQLAVQVVISQDEALAAVKTGTLPASLVNLVNALPPDQQFGANMLLCGATSFDRRHPMVAVLGQAFGWTDAQLDDLWTAASAL